MNVIYGKYLQIQNGNIKNQKTRLLLNGNRILGYRFNDNNFTICAFLNQHIWEYLNSERDLFIYIIL